MEVPPGELIDKITILEIKSARFTDPAKLRHVRAELAMLKAARDRAVTRSEDIFVIIAELKAVNEALWQIEDDLRLCERNKDFGPRFTELARSVYRQNDRRSELKRRINEMLQARFGEQKCYASN